MTTRDVALLQPSQSVGTRRLCPSASQPSAWTAHHDHLADALSHLAARRRHRLPVLVREARRIVLGTTIDKYCYIFVRKLPPFFPHKHRVVYSQIELVRDHRELVHPSVRAALMEFANEFSDGIEVQHMGDLPARSGLGSSSSFTVGLLNALNALLGKMTTPHELAGEAIRIEQHVIKESVGSQDQIWAAMGGLGSIAFHPTGRFELTPLIIGNERVKALNDCMMLFYSGQSRFASTVAAATDREYGQAREAAPPDARVRRRGRQDPAAGQPARWTTWGACCTSPGS